MANHIVSTHNMDQQFCIVGIKRTMYESRFESDIVIQFLTPYPPSLQSFKTLKPNNLATRNSK